MTRIGIWKCKGDNSSCHKKCEVVIGYNVGCLIEEWNNKSLQEEEEEEYLEWLKGHKDDLETTEKKVGIELVRW